MRRVSFSDTDSNVSGLSSTVVLTDSDFSEDELGDLPCQAQADYLAIYAMRHDLQTAFGAQKNAYTVIPLGKAFFEEPYFLSAFIVWLLDRSVSPSALMASGLLQHFFIDQYAMLVGEEDLADNPLKKTYALLTTISEKNEAVKKLLSLARKTFCGVRGTQLNQESDHKFISLNLLYEAFVTDKKIADMRYSVDSTKHVSVYDTYKLPKFSYLSENALAIYDLFGFHFLALLNLQDEMDKAVFFQLKAEDPEGLLDIFCDKASSHELTVHQVKNIFPHVTDLLAALPYDCFLSLLSKNALFLSCIIHQPSLLQKIPATIVKKNMTLLLNKNDVYADIFSLTRLLLVLQSMPLRYDTVFIAAMRECLFEKAISSEESDYIGIINSFDIFSGKEFCRKKISECRDALISTIEGGSSYQQVLLARNGFLIQAYLIARLYPELFEDCHYLLDDSQYTLPVFYIQIRWSQRAQKVFSLPLLLEECKSSLSVVAPNATLRIMLAVVRNACLESLLLCAIKYMHAHMKQDFLKAIRIVCFDREVSPYILRKVFSEIAADRLPKNRYVCGVSFMRRPFNYSAAHILLALKWIEASVGSAYRPPLRLLITTCLETASEFIFPEQPLIINIRNFANDLHTKNVMLPLKEALINLANHLERGYIEFYDLLPPPDKAVKRDREDAIHDDTPALHRHFSR